MEPQASPFSAMAVDMHDLTSLGAAMEMLGPGTVYKVGASSCGLQLLPTKTDLHVYMRHPKLECTHRDQVEPSPMYVSCNLQLDEGIRTRRHAYALAVPQLPVLILPPPDCAPCRRDLAAWMDPCTFTSHLRCR